MYGRAGVGFGWLRAFLVNLPPKFLGDKPDCAETGGMLPDASRAGL
jgi:hypothetical protein